MANKPKTSSGKSKDIVTLASKDKVKADTPEKPPKTMKMTANQIAYDVLRQQGLSKHQASKQLGLSSGYGQYTEKVTKKNYEDEIAKLAPKGLKNLKKLIDAVPYGSMIEVKDSTSLAAIKEVMDRVAPKKTINESNNLHTFIEVKVDMNRYQEKAINTNDINSLPKH